MKVCILTNYNVRRDSVNELLIYNRLVKTLELAPCDIFNITDRNIEYTINSNYTHVLVILDYEMTSITTSRDILTELKIPRVFIIDTVPEEHRELDDYFTKVITRNPVSRYVGLSHKLQTLLYEDYADGFVFYSRLDQDLFENFYKLVKEKPVIIIPPSLGKEADIGVDLSHFSPNNSIGFNGTPSFANGLLTLYQAIKESSKYSVNLYGSHGRGALNNELLVNELTENSQAIKFKGKLRDYANFFKTNHVYYDVSIYGGFHYFSYISLLNGMVPIISTVSAQKEYLSDYPFIVEPNEESVKSTLDKVYKTPPGILKQVINQYGASLVELNDERSREYYSKFLKSF